MLIKVYPVLAVGLGLNYLFNIVLAGLLGSVDYGDYSYALNIFNISALISVCALDQSSLRYIAQRPAQANQLSSFLLKFAVINGLIMGGIVYVGSEVLLSGNRRLYAQQLSIAIPVFVTLTVAIAILQSQKILMPRMYLKYLVEPLLKFICLGGLYYFFVDASAGIFALVIASCLTTCLTFAIYRRAFFSKQLLASAHKKEIYSFIRPIALSNVISVISARLDILLVGALLSSHSVGIYALSLQTAAIMAIVLQGIEMIYVARFSSIIGSDSIERLRHDYAQSLKYCLLIGGPVFIFLSGFASDVLLLFGEEYMEGAKVLVILCVAQLINLATGSANAILVMSGKTRLVLANSVALALVMITFIPGLTSYYGLVGAAIGVAIAQSLVNIIRVVQVFLVTQTHPYMRYNVKLMIAIVVIFTTTSLANQYALIVLPILIALACVVVGLDTPEQQIIRELIRKRRAV